MTYNTEGIILKYRDIGEYDRIYTVLTVEHGKIEAWAQGVRKPKSKLVAHLQPLYFCDFMFARGRRFDRVAQVKVLNRFPDLWADLEKLSQASYAVSLVDLVLRPGTKEHAVFDILRTTMTLLEQGDGSLGMLFSLKLLRVTGFSPELHHCVLCKKIVEGLSRPFNAMRGGVMCVDCVAKEGSESFPVSSLTLDTLELILDSPLSRLEMPETVRRELATIAEAMVIAHFGEEPRSRRFIDLFAQEPLYAVGTV